MEIITIECPRCKGQLHVNVEQTEIFFCMYCRSEVALKQPDPEQVEPIIVESVNHEFQAKLAIAKHDEELYRKGQLTADKVMKSYDEVRQVGAHLWEYWHARAKFLAELGLKGLEKDDQIVLTSRKMFIDSYTLWMDNALKHAENNTSAPNRK